LWPQKKYIYIYISFFFGVSIYISNNINRWTPLFKMSKSVIGLPGLQGTGLNFPFSTIFKLLILLR